MQVGEAAQGGRYSPAQLIVREGQPLQAIARPVSQLVLPQVAAWRGCPVRWVSRHSGSESSSFSRLVPSEAGIAGQLSHRFSEAAQFGSPLNWYQLPRPPSEAGQLVLPPEVQHLQLGEAAQFGGYLPAQLVAGEVQLFQVGEAIAYWFSHRGRYRAGCCNWFPPRSAGCSTCSLERLPSSVGIAPLNWFSER